MNYLLWILCFIPNLLIEIACMILAPAVACFITHAERTDRVKQLGNGQVTMMREYLIKPLYWFQTHDNAVDEYWWGTFYKTSFIPWVRNASQADYDSSKALRWMCRVLWLWRNCGYGFSYNLFGVSLEPTESVKEIGIEAEGFWLRLVTRKSSFQLKMNIPTPWSWKISTNVGWKEHKGFPTLMYAGRVIGTRSTK